MYSPVPWHATSDCEPHTMRPHECKFDMKIPDTFCEEGSNGCSKDAGRNAWFTNYTGVEERTIGEEFIESNRSHSEPGFHPWNSPGAAMTYGDGCGLNGGNPDGCEGEGETIKYQNKYDKVFLRFGAWSVLWRRQKRRRMRRICGGQVCSGTLPRGLLWQPECDHLDQRPARGGVLELSRQPQGRIRLQALQGPES